MQYNNAYSKNLYKLFFLKFEILIFFYKIYLKTYYININNFRPFKTEKCFFRKRFAKNALKIKLMAYITTQIYICAKDMLIIA